jgi:hypothetical protein
VLEWRVGCLPRPCGSLTPVLHPASLHPTSLPPTSLHPSLCSRELFVHVFFACCQCYTTHPHEHAHLHLAAPLPPTSCVIQVCPRVSFSSAVIDIRALYHVRYDDELEHCAPLREALWSVLDSWDNLSKRKFLKFVTGVDTLPAPGMETLRIEVPFMCFTPSDYSKALATLPQSHVRTGC